MGRWAATEGTDELFVVESLPDAMVSLHIPTPEPLVVDCVLAEQIRMIIGAAIGDASLGPAS